MKRFKNTLSLTKILLISLFVAATFQYASCRDKTDVAHFGSAMPSPLKESEQVARAWEVQQAFREIYKAYSNKVVFISTEQTVKMNAHPFYNDPFFREFFRQSPGMPRTQKRTGLGTGFVLSKDGYIGTNHHVVHGMDKVTVKIANKEYEAKVIGSDERTDIALLKIEADDPLEPVYLGDSDTVEVGDWAVAIGNPFGLDRTFTVGAISAIGRKDLDLMGQSQSHIQTDASINPGNSGGPLINIHGEVIGINRMIYSKTGGNMGIGFAIPVNQAKNVLEELRKHKKVKRAFIGVSIVPLTEDYAKELGLEKAEGALVGQVLEDSPAEKGGLNVGDIIVGMEDKPVKNFSDLLSIVEQTPIGKTLKVTVLRNKTKMNFFITVKERP